MPISSLFADVQLSLNNSQIEGGNRTYPYRAYIATLLQNGHEAKKEQLFAGGFIKDVAGQFNDRANAAYTARKGWTAQSRSKEFFGPLHLNFFQQSRYLISGVDIRLRLMRTQPQFCVMQLPNPAAVGVLAANIAIKVVIEKAVLHMRMVRISPSVINGHEVNNVFHTTLKSVFKDSHYTRREWWLSCAGR